MKRYLIPIALSLLLLMTMLTGCATAKLPDNNVPMSGTPQTAQPLSVTPNPNGAAAYVSPSPDELSQAQALDIALSHAGYTADQVQFLYAEYDIDDGIPLYEVDFRVNFTEYEYEIHAKSGEILSYDVDRD